MQSLEESAFTRRNSSPLTLSVGAVPTLGMMPVIDIDGAVAVDIVFFQVAEYWQNKTPKVC